MACLVGRMHPQTGLSMFENEVLESSCVTLGTCAMQRLGSEPSLSGQASKIGLKSLAFPKKRYAFKFLLKFELHYIVKAMIGRILLTS